MKQEKEMTATAWFILVLLIISINAHIQTQKQLKEFSSAIRNIKDESYRASYVELQGMIKDLPEPVSMESKPYENQ